MTNIGDMARSFSELQFLIKSFGKNTRNIDSSHSDFLDLPEWNGTISRGKFNDELSSLSLCFTSFRLSPFFKNKKICSVIFYTTFIHSFIQGLLSLIDWLIGMLELTKPMDKASESVNPSFSSMEDPEIVGRKFFSSWWGRLNSPSLWNNQKLSKSV